MGQPAFPEDCHGDLVDLVLAEAKAEGHQWIYIQHPPVKLWIM